jgi:hypothetical protein
VNPARTLPVNRHRTRGFFSGRGVWLFFLAGLCAGASAHDLTASHATVRLKADTVEVEIKIAADSAWPLVQDTVAPGALFVLEDFPTTGRPVLVAFARQMQELSAGGRAIPPRTVDVAVVEDNFVFTLSYPRPARGAAILRETYLRSTPPDYRFLALLVDENDQPLTSRILHGADPAADIALPPRTAGPTSK